MGFIVVRVRVTLMQNDENPVAGTDSITRSNKIFISRHVFKISFGRREEERGISTH